MAITESRISFVRKTMALALLSSILMACGPGGAKTGDLTNTDTSGGGTDSAVYCTKTAVGFESPVAFNPKDSAGIISTYSNDATACFGSATPTAIRSNSPITPGSGFYYFQAKVGGSASVGIATSAAPLVPNNTSNDKIEHNTNSLVVSGGNVEHQTRDGNGSAVWTTSYAGGTTTYGFAVDYRGPHPIVYVLNKNPTDNAGCSDSSSLFSKACSFVRTELELVTTPIYIYAYGTGAAGSESFVNINTGTDLTANAYVYAPIDIMRAVRSAFYRGDEPRGTGLSNDLPLLTQWPHPALNSAPVVVRTSYLKAVILVNDPTPYTSNLTATASDVEDGDVTSSIQWVDEHYTVLGTGGSLPATVLQSKLAVGEHQIEAIARDKQGISGHKFFSVKIISDDSSDDDEDGLSYHDEKTVGTDPANPDTDDDGLSDGVEGAFGLNPTNPHSQSPTLGDGQWLASKSSLATSSLATVKLAVEKGDHVNDSKATSRGVIVSEDGLQAAFTNDLNLDCVNKTGDFSAFFRNTDSSPLEMCYKRAVRANAAIEQGEFRYFETKRLLPNDRSGNPNDPPGTVYGPNVGQGFITSTGAIDPYCCVQIGGNRVADDRTPPSMSVNSLNDIWKQLVSQASFNSEDNIYTGFAVDYRGSNPIVYVFTVNDRQQQQYATGPYAGQRVRLAGQPLVSPPGIKLHDGLDSVPGGMSTIFNGQPVIPFVYGHPVSDSQAGEEINFGLKKFHYNLADVVNLIGSDGSALVPGVGIHRRPHP